MKIDLGCGPNKVEGFVGVDCRGWPCVDVIHNLDEFPWPFESGSVSYVRASHILEHLPSPLRSMGELYRILQPGGTLDIDVPSTNGMGAFQDPTHRSFWNINSFIYYDMGNALGELYGCNIWQIEKVYEYTLPQTVAFGPYVKAILRKPQNAGERSH